MSRSYAGAQSGRLKAVESYNPWALLKWLLFGGLAALIIVLVVKVRQDGLFGLFTKSAGVDGQSGDVVPQSPNAASIGGQHGDVVSNKYVTVGGKTVRVEDANLVDTIYKLLSGGNAYAYPEYVNKLATRDKARLWNCIHVFNTKYRNTGKYNKTLYMFILVETSALTYGLGTHKYAPALAAISKYGWQNK